MQIDRENVGFRWLVAVMLLAAMIRGLSCASIDDSEECDTSHKTSLYEGNECRTLADEYGICRRILDCEVYTEALRNKSIKYNSICRCGFIRFTEVICCPESDIPTQSRADSSIDAPGLPSTNDTKYERPSQAACRQWKALDPVTIEVRILGGDPAPLGMFAHMGALLQDSQSAGDTDFIVQCGSTLINERYVLTAAHCMVEGLSLPTFVRFGSVALDSNETSKLDVKIEDVYIHPEYRYPIKYHDIAILKLAEKVEFNPFVRPACLHYDTADIDPAKALVAIGWGETNTTTRAVSEVLLMTNLTTVGLNDCNKTHVDLGVTRHYKHGLDYGQYCAFDPEMKKSTCRADSGGPIQLVENEGIDVVGIVSFGRFCATAIPNVYTRVAFYLDWIESIAWPSNEM